MSKKGSPTIIPIGIKTDMVNALYGGKWDIVMNLLIEYPELRNIVIEKGGMNTMLHCIAKESPDNELTEKMILDIYDMCNGDIDIESMNCSASTPLFLASINGNFYQVSALLKLGGNKVSKFKESKNIIGSCCCVSSSNKGNKHKIINLIQHPPPKYINKNDITDL